MSRVRRRRVPGLAARVGAAMTLLSCCFAAAQEPVVRPIRPTTTTTIPEERRPYLNVRTVTGWSSEELLGKFPELKGLEFTDDQAGLPEILRKVGESVETTFRDFPNTGCSETVRERRSDPRARSWQERIDRFLYLISVRLEGEQIDIQEYRSDSRGQPLEAARFERSYLLTTGHATQALVFHPRFQSGSDFRLLGRHLRQKPAALVVAFAQRPDTAQLTGVFRGGEPSVEILLQGLAWVDPESFQILHLKGGLLTPREDAGLSEHQTETWFEEVQLAGDRTLWLPREVQVLVRFHGVEYSNRHRYRDYKLFTVDAQEGEKRIVKP